MLESLKESVFKANLDLVRHGLVIFTWGNVSAIDRASGLVVIKPTGVSYDDMTVNDMVVVNLDGKVVEGSLKPSSDTATHLELYKASPHRRGSTYPFHLRDRLGASRQGYTQYWHDSRRLFQSGHSCTRDMTEAEVMGGAYELETGRVIVERFQGMEPNHVPGVLVKNHGPFSLG
jgi:L-ribulose-5-phosphate 4-epimerase